MLESKGPRLHSDAELDDEVPGSKNIVIYCDETGMHAGTHYGFGSLWVPWERRGNLSALVQRVRDEHRYHHEVKWKNVTRHSLPFYKTLVTEFFQRRWLMFHSVIFRRDRVDGARHADRDEQYLKHLGLLINKKVGYFARRRPGRSYRLRIDRLPQRYAKSHEVALSIANAQVKKAVGEAPIHDVRMCDSSRTAGVQLADLLLGCAAAPWQAEITATYKQELVAHVAGHLGWPDLRADTMPDEWKFNLWYFYDPTSGPREVRTRNVNLLFPMPRMPAQLDRRGDSSAKASRRVA